MRFMLVSLLVPGAYLHCIEVASSAQKEMQHVRNRRRSGARERILEHRGAGRSCARSTSGPHDVGVNLGTSSVGGRGVPPQKVLVNLQQRRGQLGVRMLRQHPANDMLKTSMVTCRQRYVDLVLALAELAPAWRENAQQYQPVDPPSRVRALTTVNPLELLFWYADPTPPCNE